jgi:hypothetical protein
LALASISFIESSEKASHIFTIDTVEKTDRWINNINNQMVGDTLYKINA